MAACLLSAPTAASAGGGRTGNGQWIAYQSSRSGQEGVWLIRPAGTHNHEVALDAPGEHLLPDWSPDGRYLAFISRSENGDLIYEYDTVKNTSRQLFDCNDPCVGYDEPAFSPDGQHLAFIRYLGPFSDENLSADCSLWIGDRRTGAVRQITSNRGTECLPSGDQVGSTRDRSLWILPAAGGRPRTVGPGGPFPDFYTHGTWQPKRH